MSYLARISHGQRAHPPKSAQTICPRLMFMYLGRRTVISFAALSEFAELQIHVHGKAIARFTIRKSCRKSKRYLHICPQGSQSERERHEERSGSVCPSIDEIQWVPKDLPVVEDDRSTGNRDTNETEERKRDWDNRELNILPSETPCISIFPLATVRRILNLTIFHSLRIAEKAS